MALQKWSLFIHFTSKLCLIANTATFHLLIESTKWQYLGRLAFYQEGVGVFVPEMCCLSRLAFASSTLEYPRIFNSFASAFIFHSVPPAESQRNFPFQVTLASSAIYSPYSEHGSIRRRRLSDMHLKRDTCRQTRSWPASGKSGANPLYRNQIHMGLVRYALRSGLRSESPIQGWLEGGDIGLVSPRLDRTNLIRSG